MKTKQKTCCLKMKYMSVNSVHHFFLLKSGLDDHIEQSHSGFRIPKSPEWHYFTCRACKLTFRKEERFNKQILSIHGKNTKKRKQLEVENEERKRINTQKSMKVNVYTCNLYHKEFSKKFNVDRHKTRIHT